MKKIIDFLKDEEGASMVEYALLVALISIAAVATITILGDKIDGKFVEVNTALD